MRRLALAFAIAIAAGACGGGDDAGPADASPDAFFSVCGHPGDQGNSLGVGKFCQSLSDCQGQEALLCSILGGDDPPTFFCTMSCNGADAGPTDPDAGPTGPCGENASCQCSTGGCGCFPDSCQ
jgi:hypothetical protein